MTSPADHPAPVAEDPAGLPAWAAERLEMYRLILDSIHNGVMVTDAQGYVTHLNEPYGRFLGVDPAAQIGRHAS